MVLEENKKIKLAKEVFLHLYAITNEYKTVTEKQAQELKDKEKEISHLNEEIKNLKLKEDKFDRDKDIDVLLEEISAKKEEKIEEKQRLIDEYLKNIVNDIEKLNKNMENLSTIDCKFRILDEQIGEQLLQAVTSIKSEIENAITEIEDRLKSKSKKNQSKKTENKEIETSDSSDVFNQFTTEQENNSVYRD